MIEVIPVPAFQDNYIWLIHNPERGCVAIVDPGDAIPVIETIEKSGLTPVAILITHHHGDHIGGINELLSHYPIPVYGPARESIPRITRPLSEGDKIILSDLDAQFEIIDVPGHTAGHIAYFGHDKLFVGDTLFMSGCGRLFEGTAGQMHASLKKISALPDTTQIYCAHEYTLANLRFASHVEPENQDIIQRIATSRQTRDIELPTVPASLMLEKKTNPFLRVDIPGVIAAAEKRAGHPLADSVEVFACIREWKDNF